VMKLARVIGSLVALITACVMAVILSRHVVDENTLYAGPAVKLQFARIRDGASVDDVYALLGLPLVASVNPDRSGDGAYRQYTETEIGLSHVKRLLGNTNMEVYLFYSLPRRVSGHHYMYRVDLHSSYVIRHCGPVHMD
jgi:hypothetical protein